MTTQRSASVTEAIWKADFRLATNSSVCVLHRYDLEALLAYISTLEFEVANPRSTQIADLHAAFNRRAD